VLLVPAAPAEGHHATGLMIRKVNEVRGSHGLRPLRSSPSLTRSSARFARWMVSSGVFGHRSRVSASHRFSRLGEALAMHAGRRPGVRRTVRGWLRSPHHRGLLFTRSMNWIGAGMASGRRRVIWVLQVGRL
jgi:uncharacterized protein YkwD